MSDIIEALQARCTGMRSILKDRPLPLVSAVQCAEVESPCYMEASEYRMYIEVGTMFRCNAAQYNSAYAHARKMLARELYKDVHLALDRLRCIAYDYDNPIDLLRELDSLADSINE